MSRHRLIPASTWTRPVAPPPLAVHSPRARALIRRLRTPYLVQSWLYTLRYNPKLTLHTLDETVRAKRAHCLEASMGAATILEYHGYPPLILDLESADELDHTLFLYRRNGKYGTVAMSRDVGLYGRKPVYPNLRTLVQSYAAPYIDAKARITGYGVLDLRTLPSGQWRTSRPSVWFVERALYDLPHRRFSVSPEFLHTWRQRYMAFRRDHPNQQPLFYPHQENWV